MGHLNNDRESFRKIKLTIALIHNNDKARLNKIRPNIASLSKKLTPNIETTIDEIGYQPKIRPVSLKMGIFRDIMYWKLDREWARYRKVRNPFLPFHFAKFVIKSIIKYSHPRRLRGWLKSCAIEMILSNKHLSAIDNSLYGNTDYLLVFEDDAIFKKDSVIKLHNLLLQLKNTTKSPLYMDLGGGFDLDSLGLGELETRRSAEFRHYSRPATNTTCCYLLNKKQLMIFNHFLTKNPSLRYLGSDWLLNKLFIMQLAENITTDCRHAHPPFFEHGSASGKFESGIRQSFYSAW